MRLFAMINVGLMSVGIVSTGLLGTWAIVLSSFFMSLMFPTIFTIAIRGTHCILCINPTHSVAVQWIQE
jgi:FHS family L-fucose permease-like MFS transporter